MTMNFAPVLTRRLVPFLNVFVLARSLAVTLTNGLRLEIGAP